MTNEKIKQAKDELNELANIETYMRSVKRQRDELWSKFTAIRITNYNSIGGGHSTCDQSEQLADIVDKLDKLDQTLSDKFYEAENRKMLLTDKIRKLPLPFSEMLMRRYISHEKYEKIAVEMNYSYYYVVKRGLPIAVKKYSEID